MGRPPVTASRAVTGGLLAKEEDTIMKFANGRYTQKQRVLVVDNRPNRDAGVTKLLANAERFQVMSATSSDEDTLVQDVWQFLPDVIVLSKQSHLISPARLLALLENYLSFHLVIVSEDGNTMEVHERQPAKVQTWQRPYYDGINRSQHMANSLNLV
jgi:hypothetical protein